jgi:hypothetical protein
MFALSHVSVSNADARLGEHGAPQLGLSFLTFRDLGF